MTSPERGSSEGEDNAREREEAIERYKASLEALHQFSQTSRDLPIGIGGRYLYKGTRWLVGDLCAGIETILDNDLGRLKDPDREVLNEEGEPIDPDRAALSWVRGVADRLAERLKTTRRSDEAE